MLKTTIKNIQIFSIIFLITGTLNAQKRASLGLNFGSGVSNYFFVTDININSDFIDNNFLPVYEGGLIFNYLDKNTGIQIGVNYTQKGWIENFKNGASAKVLIDCIEFPLLTQIRFRKHKKSGWVLLFGTYGNYTIKLNDTITGTPDLALDTTWVRYNELIYNTFEFGFKGGGGFELGLGKNSLQLQVLFTQGFVNLFDSERVGVYRSLSQSLMLSAVYKFTLFRKEQ